VSRSSTTAELRTAASFAAELLDSDRRYFESGAVLEAAGGATIARVPGLERVSAGCVVQQVDPSVLPRDPGRWIELVEQRLLGHGCRRARFYLTGRHPGLEAALLARGYRPQDETGYVLVVNGRPVSRRPDAPVAELRPVTTPDDWAAKLALHRLAGPAPDGHETEPDAWVELERIRAATGWMRPFFIVSRGAICGLIALSSGASLLRLKNLVIHPSWRRMGIGTAVLHRAHAIAWREGWAGIGAFALSGDPSEQLYRGAGYEAVARQTEWMRPLGLRIDILEPMA
jgi:GNAT superfamily N-acetyltransferase